MRRRERELNKPPSNSDQIHIQHVLNFLSYCSTLLSIHWMPRHPFTFVLGCACSWVTNTFQVHYDLLLHIQRGVMPTELGHHRALMTICYFFTEGLLLKSLLLHRQLLGLLLPKCNLRWGWLQLDIISPSPLSSSCTLWTYYRIWHPVDAIWQLL